VAINENRPAKHSTTPSTSFTRIAIGQTKGKKRAFHFRTAESRNFGAKKTRLFHRATVQTKIVYSYYYVIYIFERGLLAVEKKIRMVDGEAALLTFVVHGGKFVCSLLQVFNLHRRGFPVPKFAVNLWIFAPFP